MPVDTNHRFAISVLAHGESVTPADFAIESLNTIATVAEVLAFAVENSRKTEMARSTILEATLLIERMAQAASAIASELHDEEKAERKKGAA